MGTFAFSRASALHKMKYSENNVAIKIGNLSLQS